MKYKDLIFFIMLLLGNSEVLAEKYVFLFGGGPNPNESQGSIEVNVKWISGILSGSYERKNLILLFTDGGNRGLDVRRIEKNSSKLGAGAEEPLARIFSQYIANKYEYISSEIPGNIGTSDATNVANTLRKLMSDTSSGDDVLIIYQGHGGFDSQESYNNSLRLWNNTSLSAKGISKILNNRKSEVKVRFIFPQCYSGAFSRLVYQEGEFNKGVKKNICGFVAQKQNRESEGCTDSVNTDEFSDYSYYFFSALSGKKINGETISDNPDINNDNVITLREAHLYTLANALSVDYSSSTSENYLLDWQPWYIRWLPVSSSHENEYDKIVNKILSRFGYDRERESYIPQVKSRLGSLSATAYAIKKEMNDIEQHIIQNQDILKKELFFRWPILMYSYTNLFQETINNNSEEINDFVRKNEIYLSLINYQSEYDDLNKRLMQVHREAVQLKKIIYLSRLSNAKYFFNKFANNEDKNAYANLIRCEETKL